MKTVPDVKTKPILTSVSLDGTVTVNIAHFGYTYQVDAGFIPRVQKLFQFHPWAAVNLLKQKAYHVSKQTYQQKGGKHYEMPNMRL